MIYLSQNLSENFVAEGFYLQEWDKTVTDNCGTFFGVDPVVTGCNLLFSLSPGAVNTRCRTGLKPSGTLRRDHANSIRYRINGTPLSVCKSSKLISATISRTFKPSAVTSRIARSV